MNESSRIRREMAGKGWPSAIKKADSAGGRQKRQRQVLKGGVRGGA